MTNQYFKWLKKNHRFVWCVIVSVILALMVIPVFIACITLPFFGHIKKFFCDIARETEDNLSAMKNAFRNIWGVWKGEDVRDGE